MMVDPRAIMPRTVRGVPLNEGHRSELTLTLQLPD